MWAIVIVTITWFVRDERRLRREADLADAAAYYRPCAEVSARDTPKRPLPAPAPTPRVGGLSEAQRRVFRGMLK